MRPIYRAGSAVRERKNLEKERRSEVVVGGKGVIRLDRWRAKSWKGKGE